jgi:hypothetical protein
LPRNILGCAPIFTAKGRASSIPRLRGALVRAA